MSSSILYPLSLHDALPISMTRRERCGSESFISFMRSDGMICHDSSLPNIPFAEPGDVALVVRGHQQDRKSTRLNSSHQIISYAVLCLKKKKYRRVSYTLGL